MQIKRIKRIKKDNMNYLKIESKLISFLISLFEEDQAKGKYITLEEKATKKTLNYLMEVAQLIEAKFFAVVIEFEEGQKELVINKRENFETILKYYNSNYDNNLKQYNNNIKIIDFAFANNFTDFEQFFDMV